MACLASYHGDVGDARLGPIWRGYHERSLPGLATSADVGIGPRAMAYLASYQEAGAQWSKRLCCVFSGAHGT